MSLCAVSWVLAETAIKPWSIQALLPLACRNVAWPRYWLRLSDYNIIFGLPEHRQKQPVALAPLSLLTTSWITFHPPVWNSQGHNSPPTFLVSKTFMQQLALTNLILPHSEPSLCRAPPAPPGHPWLSRWAQNRFFFVKVSLKHSWLSIAPTSNQANCHIIHPVCLWITIQKVKVITFLFMFF